jgi:hypothetical protein
MRMGPSALKIPPIWVRKHPRTGSVVDGQVCPLLFAHLHEYAGDTRSIRVRAVRWLAPSFLFAAEHSIDLVHSHLLPVLWCLFL